MRMIRLAFISTALVAGLSVDAAAATITCPTPLGSFDRQMTVTNVSECKYAGPVTGTPDADDVADLFNPDPWTNKGSLTDDGTNGWLTISLTFGDFGDSDVAGNWSVNPAFWQNPGGYGNGVLSFHLGNGSGDPDWFFFKLDTGATSGTFVIDRVTGGGGGFSNVNLWGAGPPLQGCTELTCDPPVVTPEPGTMLMLGTGLTLLAVRLRRRRS